MRRSHLCITVALVVGLGPPGRVLAQNPVGRSTLPKPPADMRLDPFYEKYIDADGIPIVSSRKVPDAALVIAADIVIQMLAGCPKLHKALVEGKARIAVMARNEWTTDLPEHRELKPKEYWDGRARGLGGSPLSPTTSCAEENLLGYEDDPYKGESILIHEFAHAVHGIGLEALDPGFDDQVKRLYDQAMRRGLWRQTYAGTNHVEYWAEGVQSYFDSNLNADPPDGIHNRVRTREQLWTYDPDLAKLIDEVFDGNPWRWFPNGAHLRKWKKKQ